MLKLYEHPLSAYAMKVKIALNEKGIDYEIAIPEGMAAGTAGGEFVEANELPAENAKIVRMKGGLSEVTEPHLFEVLGRPSRSPFGYPIPGSGEPQHLSSTTLADMAEGDSREIERVFEEDEQLLRFFDDEGIRPGQSVRLAARAPYRGTVTADINGRSIVMGTQVAGRIWVK